MDQMFHAMPHCYTLQIKLQLYYLFLVIITRVPGGINQHMLTEF